MVGTKDKFPQKNYNGSIANILDTGEVTTDFKRKMKALSTVGVIMGQTNPDPSHFGLGLRLGFLYSGKAGSKLLARLIFWPVLD